MANAVLGGIFLILVLIGYNIIYPGLQRKTTRAQLMFSCFLCIAWSAILTLFTLFAKGSGIAEMTPLAETFWGYAMFLGAMIGVIALVGAIALWITNKLNPESEISDKQNREDGPK